MTVQTSVTLSLDEYNRITEGTGGGGVIATVGLTAFAVGVIVGIITVNEPDRPAPRPPAVTVSNVAPAAAH